MKIRSFLAFDIPEEVRGELGKVSALLSSKSKGIKWIKPINMHCTMKFFGDAEEELLLGDVSKAIKDEAKLQKPIELKSIGVGVFPNWRYPRVIWAGIAGQTDDVISLHDHLEDAFEPFGFPADKRRFRLHLTLGRAKSAFKDKSQLIGIVEKMVDKEFGRFTVDRLTLYKSVLTKEGPIYTALREFPFGQ